MPKYIMLLGAPNSGKGTACRTIAEQFDLYHLSTGDMLRDHVIVGTELGKKAKIFLDSGELVPDDLILQMVKDKIENDVACCDGVVFDGFPRTIYQAQKFDEFQKLDAVVYLDVDDEVCIQRAINRRVCPSCKKIFSLSTLKGKTTCDVCGSKVIAREDATRPFAEKRLLAYKESTMPLLDYYSNILIKIDASRTVEEVDKDIISKLKEALNK